MTWGIAWFVNIYIWFAKASCDRPISTCQVEFVLLENCLFYNRPTGRFFGRLLGSENNCLAFLTRPTTWAEGRKSAVTI